MNKTIINNLSKKLNIETKQVENTIQLLSEGNTIPFIARYRKEMTNGLNEEQIFLINKEYEYQLNLQEKKEWTIEAITKKGKITDELIQQINACTKLSELENIYKPYADKKKTRAGVAINLGFQPLADYLLSLPRGSIEQEVNKYVTKEISYNDALKYAKDIIAEIVSDDYDMRMIVYNSLLNFGYVATKLTKLENDTEKKYKLYYDAKFKLNKIRAFNTMAINRAKKEKVINYKFDFDTNFSRKQIIWKYTKNYNSEAASIIVEAIDDGMKRLLIPSVENEIWSQITDEAHDKSINVFAKNLEMILCQPPLKDKNILGIDPGFRTGCKLALVLKNNKMVLVDTIYCNEPYSKTEESEKKLLDIINNNQVDLIVIGNGTASRETEIFVNNFLKKNNIKIKHLISSEIGASVYSASELARKEFPDLSVEKRSAISIARRVIDPLAELIKIDPQSIGVGQYQHDVANNKLNDKLSFVVEMIVNRIGVDLNTASEELLNRISGITKKVASNIIEYRDSKGTINSRDELKNIKGVSDKIFEQSSGFLRIKGGSNILDETSIHPEKYDVAIKIIEKYKINLNDDNSNFVIPNKDIEPLLQELNINSFDLEQIINSIRENKRDYREQYDAPLLRDDVLNYDDLKQGMEVQGVIRNIVDFGVFIDIGLKNDSFMHISSIKNGNDNIDQYEKYYIGQILKLSIKNIDKETNRVEVIEC